MSNRPFEVATALAAAIPGAHLSPRGPDTWRARIDVEVRGKARAYCLIVSERGYGAAANKLTFTLYPPKSETRRNGLTAAWHTLSVSVSGSRPDAAIVADVLRRLVNQDDTDAALVRHTQAWQAERDRESAQAAALARYVAAGARPDTNANRAAIYGPGTGTTYYLADVQADGGLYFQRLGSVNQSQALRILAILHETKEG